MGNVLDLLKVTEKFDPIFREHVQRMEGNGDHNHYFGKKNIQNELTVLMAKHVKHTVI
jgi:hypothetical protein